MSQFVDLVRIKVRSGDGGNGLVAWRREKYEPMGGPAGGTGGRGGNVVLEATHDMSTLLDFHYKKEFKALPGQKGGPKNKHGKDGANLVLKVPVGTIVRDLKTGDLIADLSTDEATAMVAQGGRGGRGNCDLSTQNNRAPYYCEPGEAGIERNLELELKLIADVGIIGLPNAGKSTLLSVLTAAKPKIADYPFSTLTPNLGVVKGVSGDGFVMADIPGLVEGASQGAGLGHKFLRHIERTRLLVHMVDASSQTLDSDIKTIAAELALYSRSLAALPRILVLNKVDTLEKDDAMVLTERIESRLAKLVDKVDTVKKILPVSAAAKINVDALLKAIQHELSLLPKEEQTVHIFDDTSAREHPDGGFNIWRKKNIFHVEGDRVERLVSVTNMRNPEALHHLFHVLRAMGVVDALLKEGIQPGQEVVIGATSFSFGEDMY
jgi:GTP-binding protein